jgi:hypothetical protein
LCRYSGPIRKPGDRYPIELRTDRCSGRVSCAQRRGWHDDNAWRMPEPRL